MGRRTTRLLAGTAPTVPVDSHTTPSLPIVPEVVRTTSPARRRCVALTRVAPSLVRKSDGLLAPTSFTSPTRKRPENTEGSSPSAVVTARRYETPANTSVTSPSGRTGISASTSAKAARERPRASSPVRFATNSQSLVARCSTAVSQRVPFDVPCLNFAATLRATARAFSRPRASSGPKVGHSSTCKNRTTSPARSRRKKTKLVLMPVYGRNAPAGSDTTPSTQYSLTSALRTMRSAPILKSAASGRAMTARPPRRSEAITCWRKSVSTFVAGTGNWAATSGFRRPPQGGTARMQSNPSTDGSLAKGRSKASPNSSPGCSMPANTTRAKPTTYASGLISTPNTLRCWTSAQTLCGICSACSQRLPAALASNPPLPKHGS